MEFVYWNTKYQKQRYFDSGKIMKRHNQSSSWYRVPLFCRVWLVGLVNSMRANSYLYIITTVTVITGKKSLFFLKGNLYFKNCSNVFYLKYFSCLDLSIWGPPHTKINLSESSKPSKKKRIIFIRRLIFVTSIKIFYWKLS